MNLIIQVQLKDAPPLPLPGGKSKTQMEEMEEFLDELLG